MDFIGIRLFQSKQGYNRRFSVQRFLHYSLQYTKSMKLAIFEFEDKTCEIGETSWILHEDEGNLNNEDWQLSREVIVKWPKDFGKVSRKIGKTSVDIEEIDSILCTAHIIAFSGKCSLT